MQHHSVFMSLQQRKITAGGWQKQGFHTQNKYQHIWIEEYKFVRRNNMFKTTSFFLVKSKPDTCSTKMLSQQTRLDADRQMFIGLNIDLV